jgi:hypothetical protein
MEPWYIRLGGDSGEITELGTLGLALVSVELNSMRPDVVRLTHTRAHPGAPLPVSYNQQVELWRGGERVFSGRARPGVISVGPWTMLEEITWQHAANGMDGSGIAPVPGQPAPGFDAGPGAIWIGGAWVVVPGGYEWVFADSWSWDPETMQGQIGIDLFWTAHGWLFRPRVGGMVYRTVELQLGGLLGGLDLPADEFAFLPTVLPGHLDVAEFELGGGSRAPRAVTVSDISLAEAVRQTLSSYPDVSCWVDYSTSGVPRLHVQRAEFGRRLSLSLGSGVGEVTEYQLRVAEDLVPTGVVLSWERDWILTPTSGSYQPVFVDKWPEQCSRLSPGVLIHTISNSNGEIERRTPGLAREIYESLAVVRTQGTVSVHDPNFSLRLRPGLVVDLRGDPHLERAQTWLQSVRWDAASGKAVCQAGYPRHLGLAERMDLRGWLTRVFSGFGWRSEVIVPPPEYWVGP